MAESRIVTSGLNSARTLNKLAEKGITVKDAKREGNVLVFSVPVARKNATVKVLESVRLESHYRDKKSFFEKIFSPWRFGIALGLLLSLLCYLILSSFVLRIDVIGVDRAKAIEIEKFLGERGIFAGSPKGIIDEDELDALLLEKFDFSVVQSKIVGLSLSLTVKEELNKPNYYDATAPVSLIAVEDALVTRVVCLQGTQSIDVGKSVKAGEVLILAQKTVGEETLPIRAVGEVYGKVWREKEIFFPDEKVIFEPTGRVEKYFSMRVGEAESEVRLPSFEHYTVQKSTIKIGDFLPVYRDTYVYAEQKAVTVSNNDEDKILLIENAKKEILLNGADEDGVFIRSWTIERQAEGGRLVKVIAEFEKRIDKYA